MKRIALFLYLFLGAFQAFGYDNFCREYSNSPVRSLCPTRSFLTGPSVRNFNHRSHQIQCSGNEDSHIRTPQPFDFRKWAELRARGDEDQAFKLRQSLPDIEWSGQVPFQTFETWEWQECALGTSSSICGTEEVCDDVDKEFCEKDKNGHESCETRKVRECTDVPKTCWYDQDRSSSLFCTNETMTYRSEFSRPDASWTPAAHPYAPFIPNKYDLLPGELENIQTYNNTNMTSSVTPSVAISDAWNKYAVAISPSQFACTPNGRYDIQVRIDTLERDISKASPNAMRLPVDINGQPVEAVRWVEEQIGGTTVKKYPSEIKLQDQSAAVISSIANHSAKNQEREKLKADLGVLGAEKSPAMDKEFMKNTVVKIRLKKKRLLFDRGISKIYSEDWEAVQPDSNNLSNDEMTMQSENWTVDLINNSNNIYGRYSPLRPNRVYSFEISMYQKGVPFYRQNCDEDSGVKFKKMCNLLPFFWGKSDSKVFSKPMEIQFETSKKYDGRDDMPAVDRILTKTSEAIDPFAVFEWLFHKRTTGVNP